MVTNHLQVLGWSLILCLMKRCFEVPWLRDLHFLLRRVKPGRENSPWFGGIVGWYYIYIYLCTHSLIQILRYGCWTKNRGFYPPNHPFVHRVFHEINHPFWGTPIFGNIHILRSFASETCDVLSCQIVGLAEAMACDISRGVVSRKPSGQDVACWEGSEFGILNNLKVS